MDQKKRPNPAKSLSDDDNCKKKLKSSTKNVASGETSKKDVQEYSLTDLWLKIKKEVESSEKAPKKVVRKVLAYFRTRVPKSNSSQAEISPVYTVPVEMWTEIFDYISEPYDLINCAASCSLFESVLEQRKTHILFGAVLPHISEYLKQKEILNCRLVCKQWDKRVCTLAGSCRRFEPKPEIATSDLEVGKYLQQVTSKPRGPRSRLHSMQLCAFYIFCIPNTDDSQRHHFSRNRNFVSIQTELKHHPRNPFIGGDAHVSKNLDVPVGPRFCIEINNLLNDIGRHLTSLDLVNVDNECPEDICTIVSCVFKTCLKLSWFALGERFCPPPPIKGTYNAKEINALPYLSSLRYLDIDTRNVDYISHVLFTKYSNQLVRLVVHEWDIEFFQSLQWRKLNEMTVDAHLTEKITSSLERFDSPQLWHLTLYFGRNRTTLKNTLQAINSFPRLTSLQFNFCGEAVVPKEEEVLGVPAEIMCRSSITSLILKDFESFISYDFLLCFPLLKKLVLCVNFSSYKTAVNLVNVYTPRSVTLRYEKLRHQINRLQAKDSLFSSSCTSNAMDAPGRNEGEPEYLFGRIIHLNQYLVKLLVDNGSAEANVCLYRSNIWEILPFLQNINVHNGYLQPYLKKVFSRSGYLDGGFSKVGKQL